MPTSVLKVEQILAVEAITADIGHGSLDAGLVTWRAHARGVDHEAARLGVFQKGERDLRRQRVRLMHNRLRVVRDQDLEDAAEEGPGRLTRFNRRLCRLLEHRIDEAI